MKVSLVVLAALGMALGAPTPNADPEAFFPLGVVALPAVTGSALVDGLLLGKVAFLKAAILANLLLGSSSGGDASDEYGAPDAYGPPDTGYGPPVDTYEAQTYEEPAIYEEPVAAYAPPQQYEPSPPSYQPPQQSYQPADTYGAPQADVVPSYNY